MTDRFAISGGVVFPFAARMLETEAASPATAVAGEGRTYPVPGRDELRNRRIAGHEIGHAVCARALGSVVHFVTIIPDLGPDGYEGRCVRSGPPSQLNLDQGEEPVTHDVVDISAICERLVPEIGTGRVEYAEGLIRAQTLCVELMAGRAAERVLHPDHLPLPAEHDQVEAAALARVACATPDAVSSMLAYCESEAEALIRANLHVVSALVDAIIERGTLDGTEVDAIIMQAVAAKAAADERQRRAAWAQTCANAAAFKPALIAGVRSGEVPDS